MIPKGLKVGQTYLEGNLVYKVTEVIGDDRYVGQWTGEISSAPISVEKPKVVQDSKPDYSSMQYAQLKKLCAERGLDATGKKDELVARLEG